MAEIGGDDGKEREEVSLLAEELVQLSVKGPIVTPSDKPTLICSIWIEKLYNPESFKAQMKSIWKTKKKFEIKTAGQNLFLIIFELEEDLEAILEGRPWLFRKSLILFNRILQPIERSQIRLNSSPFWLKIGACSPEFDKKDLLHAIGVSFGGVLRSEINGDVCRLRINLDVQKPLRRGIFVSTDNINKSWVSFKYEKLPLFYFGCGRMGHGLIDCQELNPAEKNKVRIGLPFLLALKAESNLIGKESMKLNALSKTGRVQCCYTGGAEVQTPERKIVEEKKSMNRQLQNTIVLNIEDRKSNEREEELKSMEDVLTYDNNYKEANKPNLVKKIRWKRIKPVQSMVKRKEECDTRKRKSSETEMENWCEEVINAGIKRLKKEGKQVCEESFFEEVFEVMDHDDNLQLMRSTAAKWQTDRTQ